ncbi:MAG: response regulator transcription factor [Bacteroidota bacterium]
MIRLLIVDDHPIVIDGIRQMLAQTEDISLVGAVCSAQEALDWVESHEADVIILDISLPDMDGMDLCKLMVDKRPQARIIGLTTYEEVSFVSHMLRNGAQGYLFKGAAQEEVITAIRAVAQGQRYLGETVNQKLLAKAMYGSSSPSTFIPKLTRREKEVLQGIMEELTTQEIADKLFITVSTVETHRKHLISKLGVRNMAGLVQQAIKFGLV